ncbi:Lon protease [Aquisphaera giovannonii]|uniref:Lon protease n=1 Tax=Aquisphaera giovannonii TaxID=406548 RepID=A0A5B9W6T2_9BACT|nr:LON peptidase substrate-binding domain-containing protein [Aquisphaera giovannonii]QEH35775.1 Lon protease [Aquisphaera giovannonii]
MIVPGFDPRDFSGQTRLFPLPGVVVFPHAVVPLHIFEPRYRQMTEDALESDRLITLVQIRRPPAGEGWKEPVPIEETGCLGQILQHVRLPDGRFNMLLLGLKRVAIRSEVEGPKLYRTAEVDILEDDEPEARDDPRREELVDLFRRFHEERAELGAELIELLEKPLPLGPLSDIMAHALALPPVLKQDLLGETAVDRRVAILLNVLRELVPGGRPKRTFPPPFSLN